MAIKPGGVSDYNLTKMYDSEMMVKLEDQVGKMIGRGIFILRVLVLSPNRFLKMWQVAWSYQMIDIVQIGPKVCVWLIC